MLSSILATNPALSTQMQEPLSASSLLVGNTAYAIMGALVLIGLVGVPLRSLGLLAGLARRLTDLSRRLWMRDAVVVDPERPLTLLGLTPGLSKLAQHTRTLALELRRRCQEARHWPDDAAELEQVKLGWLRTLLSEGLDFTPILDTRQAVFEWIQSAEGLEAIDRDTLAGLGVDVEAVRELLESKQPVAEIVRGLAGLMWSIDERLAGATSNGYRANGHAGARTIWPSYTGSSAGSSDEDLDDELERERRRRFAEVVGAHGSGLSRMAGSYSRGAAEREDLEQDIALALWQSLPKFRGESKLETFVYRVARYCCYRHIRRRGRFPADADAVERLDDPTTCIESAVLEADARAQVERALSSLPDSLESTLSLHLSGLSYAEIADQLGISERNVSVRLTRARHKLRAQLAA